MPPGGIGNNTTRKPEAVLSRRVVRHSVVSLVSRAWGVVVGSWPYARAGARARVGTTALSPQIGGFMRQRETTVGPP